MQRDRKVNGQNFYHHGINGRAQVSPNRHGETARLKFPRVYPDQLETIQLALAVARRDGETKYDSVALELVCMEFLATHR